MCEKVMYMHRLATKYDGLVGSTVTACLLVVDFFALRSHSSSDFLSNRGDNAALCPLEDAPAIASLSVVLPVVANDVHSSLNAVLRLPVVNSPNEVDVRLQQPHPLPLFAFSWFMLAPPRYASHVRLTPFQIHAVPWVW